MPGGRGRPRRACVMCNFEKYLGNSAGRRPARDRRVLQTDDGAGDDGGCLPSAPCGERWCLSCTTTAEFRAGTLV